MTVTKAEVEQQIARYVLYILQHGAKAVDLNCLEFWRSCLADIEAVEDKKEIA